MQYRLLGKNGPKIPVLGLGTWPLGGGMGYVDEQVAIDTIRWAIDHGVTLIDTAQVYRTSEATIGKALKDGYRERCFLATKVSRNYSREAIITAMDNSLKLLGVDYVDLYQIHGFQPEYPIEESMETMAQLQMEGKARYLGVSNFNHHQMHQALNIAEFVSNQPRYNMFDRHIEIEDIAFCEQAGIGLLTHSPLAKGLLTGKYAIDSTFTEDDERSKFPRFQGEVFERYLAAADSLKEIAQDKGLNLVQLSIAWILRIPTVSCVLVGAKNVAQVKDHLGALGVTFSNDELTCIKTIVAGFSMDLKPLMEEDYH